MAPKRKLAAARPPSQPNKKRPAIAPTAKEDKTKAAMEEAVMENVSKKAKPGPSVPSKSPKPSTSVASGGLRKDMNRATKLRERNLSAKQMSSNAAAHYIAMKAKAAAKSKNSNIGGRYILETNQFKSKSTGNESVLVRPTERAKRFRAHNKPKTSSVAKMGRTLSSEMEKSKSKPFRMMDLPKELRDGIWELVVVETKNFIFPDSTTGKEQPDLAMVSRQVRTEVLRIYYEKNVFAVDLTGAQPIIKTSRRTNRQAVERLEGIAAVEKWAGQLEKGQGCFFGIRKWAFCYYESTRKPITTATSIILDNFEEKTVIVSVSFHKLEGRAWTASVELHGQAPCILPGHEAYNMCKVKLTPKWLNTVVGEVTDACDPAGPIKGLIVGLAKSIKLHGPELVDFRCEQTVKKVAPDCVLDESGCIHIDGA